MDRTGAAARIDQRGGGGRRRDTLTVVPDRPVHAIRCLKPAGHNSVWLINRPDQQLRTLKRWPISPILLLKLAMGIAQPQRLIRGGRRLARAGIRTASPVDGWSFQWRGWPPVVELELAYVPGRSGLEWARDASVDDQLRRRHGVAIGRVVAELAGAGLFHRDLKLSNLIFGAADDEGGLWLIDTVGIRRMRRRDEEIARMLERLAVQVLGYGIPFSRASWMPALLNGLRPQPPQTRRAVLRRLKSRTLDELLAE